MFWDDTHHFREGKRGDNVRNVVCSCSEFHLLLPEHAVEKPLDGALLLKRSHNQQRALPLSRLQSFSITRFVFSVMVAADFMTAEYFPWKENHLLTLDSLLITGISRSHFPARRAVATCARRGATDWWRKTFLFHSYDDLKEKIKKKTQCWLRRRGQLWLMSDRFLWTWCLQQNDIMQYTFRTIG